MGACKGKGCKSGPSCEVHEARQQASTTASMAMNLEHLGLARGGDGWTTSHTPPDGSRGFCVTKATGGWGRTGPRTEARNGGALRRIHLTEKAGITSPNVSPAIPSRCGDARPTGLTPGRGLGMVSGNGVKASEGFEVGQEQLRCCPYHFHRHSSISHLSSGCFLCPAVGQGYGTQRPTGPTCSLPPWGGIRQLLQCPMC